MARRTGSPSSSEAGRGQRRSGLRGLALGLVVIAAFVAPVAKASVFNQDDDDLIFDEELLHVEGSRLRRAAPNDIAPVVSPIASEENARVKRQFWPWSVDTDDEDEVGSAVEGSGTQDEKYVYRIKITVVEAWSTVFLNDQSSTYQNFASVVIRAITHIVEDIPGEKYIRVSKIEQSRDGNRLVTVDINSESYVDHGSEIKSRVRRALQSGRLESLPVSTSEFFFTSNTAPDIKERPCTDQEIPCLGQCLPLSKRCNRVKDCEDGTDEEFCPYDAEADSLPPVLEVPDTSGSIPTEDLAPAPRPVCDSEDQGPVLCDNAAYYACRCDGRVECPNGEDESETTCGRRESPDYEESVCLSEEDEYLCHDGLTIACRCDGLPECPNNEDEDACDQASPPPPPPYPRPICESEDQGPVQCDNAAYYACRCDGHVECPNGEDESETTCGRRESPDYEESVCLSEEDEYLCLDGLTIACRCDGLPECPNNEDEDACGQGCTPNQFPCDNNLRCFDIDQMCDGFAFCADGADERNCPPKECATNEFRCNDGSCIEDFRRCDYVDDCKEREDEKFCACDEPNFMCNTGHPMCIESEKHCNGVPDCEDGSDEMACHVCQQGQFTCTDKSCIPITQRCDGAPNCGDNSDEVGCDPSCTRDEFPCDDGLCLHITQRCNGRQECSRGEDEKGCSHDATCTSTEFACNSGQCIDTRRRCDGNYDCLDNSDERGCPATRNCTADQWRCNDGVCIEKTWLCDSVPDCEDASDENECSCGNGEFRCGDGICIKEVLRCDGRNDCVDASDEKDCRICEESDFICADGSCIPRNQRCDSNPDCIDGSDELNCEACQQNEFQCANGLCIDSRLHCDGIRDCEDGSDENCEVYPDYTTQRPPLRPCRSDEFRCDNGACIDKNKQCDLVSDCEDYSDEHYCPRPPLCTPSEFQCDDGDCIEGYLRCNDIYDCLDASDEYDCPTRGPPRTTPPPPEDTSCSPYEFTCLSGECISKRVVCDRRADCRDGSDERNCSSEGPMQCKEYEFQCADGSCIPDYERCDGYYRCRDGSDEANCGSETRCPSYLFECLDGGCISQNAKCDGRFDCRDGSDEADCQPTCGNNQFQCQSGECINANAECDGKYDCYDQSDEANCPTELPTVPEDYFTCQNDQIIHVSKQCDGTADCADGSDEIPGICGPHCSLGEFECLSNRQCIPGTDLCDGKYDCDDYSDESDCGPDPSEPSDRVDLKTYPDQQTIQQSREVVFQCRDEGSRRAAVKWVREGGRLLPPGATDIRGRLTMPNIQIEHSGNYYCEAQDVPGNMPGRRKQVQLRVTPFSTPAPPTSPTACGITEATCRNGQCIPKDAICDGDFDCEDGSDESRCNPLGCEPNEFRCDNQRCVLKTWLCDSDDDCLDNSDERNCAPNPPGSFCRYNEFACHNGTQCVPKSFHCDGEVDCIDGSDEFGCTKPIIREPPPRTIMIEVQQTFNITCTAIGIPMPTIVWRLNWGHVPDSCVMTSENGFGFLSCPNAKPTYQGAYSCEAINSQGSVFAQPDAIVTIKGTEDICQPPEFNAGATSPNECVECFCFGATDQCYSSDRDISQLPPPASERFQLVGVNQDQFEGKFVIRDTQYPLSSTYLKNQSDTSVQLRVNDRTRIGGPSDLLIYFSMPQSHKGAQLTSYGGYLRYTIAYSVSGAGQELKGPDVIIRGNGLTLMHVHDGAFRPSQTNQVDVRFWPGQWFKSVVGRGRFIQTQEPASRQEIMMVLENIDLMLIRALYEESQYVDATLSDVQLDTAVFSKTNQGQAVYVEDCRCPEGYFGMSCEQCAPNYKRVLDGHWLGRCVPDEECQPGEYGDPINNIPCLPCPCPLTNPANQFSESCLLDTDGQVTCNCPRGYMGRRCEICAPGYEGNPTVPGDYCKPTGECNSDGSRSIQADPVKGCQCKEFATGPKCDQCKPNSFYLNEKNQHGCINCFCMGITDKCTSSNWYRQQVIATFHNDRQGFELVDQNQQRVIGNEIVTDAGRQELVYRDFSRLGQDVYYWKLPQKFLGDKVTSYGGNLTYTLRYIPSPGGQRSRNNAYSVEIHGNDVTLRYYSSQQLEPNRLETVSVPFYDQYWQRQDGQIANREHFLMALADLEYIHIKATYTTNTIEAALQRVEMDIADSHNTNQERALAVEMCDCPIGHKGLSCEDCDVGYTRSLSDLYLRSCEPCMCNGHAEECHPETGECFNCRDNTAGDFCDECAPGYDGDAISGTCTRADQCSCNPMGSISTTCIGNRCQCKANVKGDHCDACNPGHFNLQAENPLGCSKCWCNDATTQCFSSNYYRMPIPMDISESGFTLINSYYTDVIRSDFDVNIRENEISFSQFNKLRGGETYYWSLPQKFTGNRLTSYGGNLTITQRYDADTGSNHFSDADIIIRSAGGKEFVWMNPTLLLPGQPRTYSVHLIESSFSILQKPATRREFLHALSSVEAILVRATLSGTTRKTYIRDVVMDNAVPTQVPGRPRAIEVEQCRCPPQYRGLSCEECAPGYYHDPSDNSCKKCECSGHEESCALGSDGRVRCTCLPGYSGDFCENSGPDGTPTENPLVVNISGPQIHIVALAQRVELRCSGQSLAGGRNRVSVKWSKQGGILPYDRAYDNRQGLLIISQVQAGDSGTYLCTASDGYFYQTAEVKLEVSGRPELSVPQVIIEERREEIEILIGEDLEITCIAEGNPPPQLQWTRGPNLGLPRNVQQANGVLYFSNLQVSDSGEYFCVATNSQGKDSGRIIITVRPNVPVSPTPQPPQPSFTVQLSHQDLQIRTGETARISCSSGNVGYFTTVWRRHQGVLPSQSTQYNGELIIPNVRPADSGIYICIITDQQGRSEQSAARITVRQVVSLPSVRIEPDRQTINQGSNAELRCIALGDPTPNVTWSKVNEEFSNNVQIEGNSLLIKSALITDRGMYVCTAQNDGGTAQAAAIIEVERREPPVIEIYPEVKQSIVVGASALFQCHLTAGIPSPVVIWSRVDGQPITPNTEILNGGVLRFNQVTGNEQGSYMCTATNDAGSTTAIATLEILSVPVISFRPSTSPYQVKLGQKVRLECSAEGDPAPAVSWQRLQVNFPANIPSRSVTPTTAVYEIQRVTKADEGTYQCTARNAAGLTEERFQLLVIDSVVTGTQFPPRPPFTDSGVIDTHSQFTPQPPLPDDSNIIRVALGGRVEIQCHGIGPDYADVQLEWIRSDQLDLPPDHHTEGGYLYINNAGPEAGGEYACQARDRQTGRILSTGYTRVEIVAPPRIRLEPGRQVVRPGANVFIRCTASGDQPITISWTKETGFMPPSVIINGGELLFRGIAVSDAGRYVCEATNNVGSARAVAEVIVNEEPLLAATQQEVVAYVGQAADLRCESSGINPANIQWSREGAALPRTAVSRGNLLRLNNVQVEDGGRYFCEARTRTGIATSDYITLRIERLQSLDIHIRPSTNNVRVGEPLELTCDVVGYPRAVIRWLRRNGGLPLNARQEGNVLRFTSVEPDNGGFYLCMVTTDIGVFERDYPLAIQSPENFHYNTNARSVDTRNAPFGSSVIMECRTDLAPPVSYTWSKQGGQLPLTAVVQDRILEIPEVHAEDAGTYVCTARNSETSLDLPTLLVVTGVVPSFSRSSYLSLTTLPDAYLIFDLEISFRPDAPNGLIMYNGQRPGLAGDFVSFGMSDGHAEFRFDVGSGPAVIRSPQPIELGQWHTVKLSRNRKDGTMVVDGGTPVSDRSEGRFQGLDLIEPMYIGGVPDYSAIHRLSGFSSGFAGCISRLVIGSAITELLSDAQAKVRVASCDTCAVEPCQNGGVCQEAYTEKGHKCICPAGFSGEFCQNTGEACYPGVCGTGRCINKPGGFECFCPFGKTGMRCEQEINIYEPSFEDGSYIAYPTPRALRRFSVGMNLKPQNLEDGVLMYCAQKERGDGDFTSLALRNKRLEFKFNTGTGTATLQSEEIKPGEWIKVHANRTDRLGSLTVNDGEMMNAESPGLSRGLNLRTPLFIGGVDTSRVEMSPEVQVTSGFYGCVSEIKIQDQEINLSESLVDSANVGQCGGMGSPCSREPCFSQGQCIEDNASPQGYRCICPEGFSGLNCEEVNSICSSVDPCLNDGICQGTPTSYICQCPLGFAGQHCEHSVDIIDSSSFSGQSWIEFDRNLFPQTDGGAKQWVTLEFSTVHQDGLLFWYGQGPNTQGRGKDFVSLAMIAGYLEFSYELGTGPAIIRSVMRYDDGDRHSVTIRRTGRQGSLEVDGNIEYGDSPGSLHMLNAEGNIYIGGVPNHELMTGGQYLDGFQGCIHSLSIDTATISDILQMAISGVNVTPCPRAAA